MHGWSNKATCQAIEEYRKFLYLAAISDRKVTPSRKVDAVWHLHLTYTQNYWDGLCDQILGGAMHHEPATGPAEAGRFADQYRYTHALYQREFGHPRPRKYWTRRPRDGTGQGAGMFNRAGLFAAGAAPVWAFVTVFTSASMTWAMFAGVLAGLGVASVGCGD